LGRNVEIQEQVNVLWTCDNCGATIPDARPLRRKNGPQPPPPKCIVCRHWLCKRCKRNVCFSIGSGNGLQVPHQITKTQVLCPSCLDERVPLLFDLLRLAHDNDNNEPATSPAPVPSVPPTEGERT